MFKEHRMRGDGSRAVFAIAATYLAAAEMASR